MFGVLVQKELKQILQSPKFVTTFLTCTILILISIFTGATEFNAALEKYNAAVSLNINEMEGGRSYSGLNNKVYRKPSVLQIFSSGINNDLGRYSNVSNHSNTYLQSSYYSEDPIFAVFRYLDFTFIVSTILSLFAILFTYNAINGEKEGGTLKLIFSNTIARVKFIGAKFLGSWLALVIPLSIPVLLSLLLLMLLNVPISGSEWGLITFNILLALIYFTFFIALGILVSTLSKTSSVSFLILLVSWIAIVFILPRVGTMMAGQLVNVPSVAETKSIVAKFEKNKWQEHFNSLQDLWSERNAQMSAMNEEEKEAFKEENNWGWMEEEDKARSIILDEISNYSDKVNNEMILKKNKMQKLALTFSRFSPASSYQLASMNLSGSDVLLKQRFENDIKEYKKDFVKFTEKKQEESGGMGGVQISLSSESGLQITDGRSSSKIDISGAPVFSRQNYSAAKIFSSAFIDMGLLMFYSIISFFISMGSFLKFDLR